MGTKPLTVRELSTPKKITWCPGCGNFAILTAVKRAIVELKIKPEDVLIVSGIGCHGKISDYINVNTFHTIHGRVIPFLAGAKIANHKLVAIGFAGDGDAYSIGWGHLTHAARRNDDIVYIVHNNMVFGLTTGQYTPTSPRNFKSRSTPYGSIEEPLNPILLSLASGSTFVARAFSGDIQHLTMVIKEAIKHKGFAHVDVLQPCVTFYNTYQEFSKKIYKLEDSGHDPGNWDKAVEKAVEWLGSGDRIPIGIFYRNEERKPYTEMLSQIRDAPLVFHKIESVDISPLLEESM